MLRPGGSILWGGGQGRACWWVGVRDRLDSGWPVEWSVGRLVGAVGGALAVSPALPSLQPGWSQHPVSELVGETGGAAQAHTRGGPKARRAHPARWSAALRQPGRSPPCGGRGAGGDGGLPGHPSGDHDPQPSEQGRGQRGARLGVVELVVGAAGEVGVAGLEDRVVRQRTPDGPPGGQPQGGPARPEMPVVPA
jgi:hypothetical protein